MAFIEPMHRNKPNITYLLQPPFTKFSLKITYLKLNWDLPEANELNIVLFSGNGPSGIALSYMLAGNTPYHNGVVPSDEYLHMRLLDGKEQSLYQQVCREKWVP